MLTRPERARTDPHPRPAGRTPHPAAAGTREAVGIWVGSRVSLLLFVVLTSWLMNIDAEERLRSPGQWLLHRLVWRDSFHFLRIADIGYPRGGQPCCDQAFFPGYPAVIRLFAPLFGGNLMICALVVAEVAGAAATIVLWHLGTQLTGDPRVGRYAALFLAVAPYGIFLSAAYSESLFLALTVGAWLAAVRRRWWLAGVLAGGAAAVRINGLFLAAALAVMYVMQLREDGRLRPRADAAALLVPLAATAAFFGALDMMAGSWNAWGEAEKAGWDRGEAWPWEGLKAGWDLIHQTQAPHVVFAGWADLLSAVGGIVLVVVLAVRRRWPEATYVAPNVAVLVCSTTLLSSSRYALLWFPGYLLVASLARHRAFRWLPWFVVVVCAPLMATLSLLFAAHAWIG